MDSDTQAFLFGGFLGILAGAFLVAILFVLPAATSKAALCDRALLHATPSDSVAVAKVPYRCDLSYYGESR